MVGIDREMKVGRSAMMAQARQATETSTAQDRLWTRLTAVAGLLYVVLTVAALIITGNDATPADPLSVVRAYFVDNRTVVLASVYLGTLGMTCFLAFAAGLGGLVARRGGDSWGILARLMLAGALGSFAITTVVNLAEAALAFRGAAAGEPATIEALFDLLMMVPLTVVPLAAFMVAAAAGIVRSAVLPRWLGWAVLLPALLGISGGAGLGDPRGTVAGNGFGGYLLFLVWALATSVMLLVRREATLPVGQQRVAAGGQQWQAES
jgi:hypothetical protein